MNLSQGIFSGVSNESNLLFYRTYNVSNEKIAQRANEIHLRLSQASQSTVDIPLETMQNLFKFRKRNQQSNNIEKGEEISRKILSTEEIKTKKLMSRFKNSHSTFAILEEVRNEENGFLSRRISELNENFTKSVKYLEERVLLSIEKEKSNFFGEISLCQFEAKEAIEKRSLTLIDEIFPKSLRSLVNPQEKPKSNLRKKLNLSLIQSKSNSSLFEVLKGKNEIEKIRLKRLNK